MAPCDTIFFDDPFQPIQAFNGTGCDSFSRVTHRMYGELVPQGGGDPVPLLKTKLLVGRRDTSCDIALRFPNVSSRHCELELVGGYWLVRDLGSSNGTKVNGVR